MLVRIDRHYCHRDRQVLPLSSGFLSSGFDSPLVSDLTIRRYEPRDADSVWDLHERALRDVGRFDPEFAHLDADLRAIPDAYLDTGGEFLVGERAGEIVGMGALQPSAAVEHHDTDSGTAVVRRMRVDPDQQRRGYGSEILRALETRATELGFDRLVLDTMHDQTSAQGLYESFGYDRVGSESTPAGEMLFYEKVL